MAGLDQRCAQIVTVVSGEFCPGMGEEADPAAARPLGPGSFFAFDPGMAHYAFARGETVVQLSAADPWGIDCINPEDDPRRLDAGGEPTA